MSIQVLICCHLSVQFCACRSPPLAPLFFCFFVFLEAVLLVPVHKALLQLASLLAAHVMGWESQSRELLQVAGWRVLGALCCVEGEQVAKTVPGRLPGSLDLQLVPPWTGPSPEETTLCRGRRWWRPPLWCKTGRQTAVGPWTSIPVVTGKWGQVSPVSSSGETSAPPACSCWALSAGGSGRMCSTAVEPRSRKSGPEGWKEGGWSSGEGWSGGPQQTGNCSRDDWVGEGAGTWSHQLENRLDHFPTSCPHQPLSLCDLRWILGLSGHRHLWNYSACLP